MVAIDVRFVPPTATLQFRAKVSCSDEVAVQWIRKKWAMLPILCRVRDQLIGDNRSGFMTRFRTPWAWFSSNGLLASHVPTEFMSSFTTLGRTLQVTWKGEPFSL